MDLLLSIRMCKDVSFISLFFVKNHFKPQYVDPFSKKIALDHKLVNIQYKIYMIGLYGGDNNFEERIIF